MYQIIALDTKDSEQLSALAKEIYPQHYAHLWNEGGVAWYIERSYNTDTLRKELENPKSTYYFVQNDEAILGYLKLNFDTPLSINGKIVQNNTLELQRIYLLSKATGVGLGAKMVNFAIQKAQENNLEMVWLQVMDTSTDAIRFYEKMGFRIHSPFRLDFELMKPELRGMYTLVLKVNN